MKTVLSPLAVFGVAFVLFLGTGFLFGPPQNFSAETVTVESGMAVSEAAHAFAEAGAVRSRVAFVFLVRLMNPSGGATAGTYALQKGESAFSLAYRLAHGDTGIPPVRVTVPEGYSSREISALLREKLSPFDSAAFQKLAQREEGYLFPDTYHLTPGMSPESVIAFMRQTFDQKTMPLADEIAASGRTLADTVTMASLLEKEARLPETRRIVAGILWKRLDRGMPLQVDAVFGYIMGTTTFSPSFAQLSISSPYNTYTHAGLPPGPIGNPGLEALEAALHPTATPYYFYLTGADGTMHYARTLEEHKANRKYLRSGN